MRDVGMRDVAGCLLLPRDGERRTLFAGCPKKGSRLHGVSQRDVPQKGMTGGWGTSMGTSTARVGKNKNAVSCWYPPINPISDTLNLQGKGCLPAPPFHVLYCLDNPLLPHLHSSQDEQEQGWAGGC